MIPAVRPILGGLSANSTEQLRDLTVSVRAEEPWESLIQNYEEEKKKTTYFLPTSPSLQNSGTARQHGSVGCANWLHIRY